METEVLGDVVQRWLELIGIFAFGVSGALLAVRKGFDVVGIVVLAWVTALGGGVIRDVLLGINPPDALRDVSWFSLPLVAAAVTFFAHPLLQRFAVGLMLFDAMGLALFTVVGTLKASAVGLGVLPAAAVGVVTGVGGGLLRDIVAREVPVLVRADAELYSLPAIGGALVVAAAVSAGGYSNTIGIVAAVAIVVFRILAVVFSWRAPQAWRRERKEA